MVKKLKITLNRCIDFFSIYATHLYLRINLGNYFLFTWGATYLCKWIVMRVFLQPDTSHLPKLRPIHSPRHGLLYYKGFKGGKKGLFSIPCNHIKPSCSPPCWHIVNILLALNSICHPTWQLGSYLSGTARNPVRLCKIVVSFIPSWAEIIWKINWRFKRKQRK